MRAEQAKPGEVISTECSCQCVSLAVVPQKVNSEVLSNDRTASAGRASVKKALLTEAELTKV